jgi:hypothetical protein
MMLEKTLRNPDMFELEMKKGRAKRPDLKNTTTFHKSDWLEVSWSRKQKKSVQNLLSNEQSTRSLD